MFNWIRRQFCNHELELVKQNEYPSFTITSYICKKCGYVRTVKTGSVWL